MATQSTARTRRSRRSGRCPGDGRPKSESESESESRTRPALRAALHHAGRASLRRRRVGDARRGDRQRARRAGLRAEGRRGAEVLVADRDQRGGLEVLPRPRSARRSASRACAQLISRVADTIADWGREGGYFATAEDAETFHAELTHILLHQMACFNSPVWFNVGIEAQPQCSACFINSVEDTMESILGLAKTEGMLFKYGSGTGSNLSTPALVARAAGGRRHGLRPGLVHEGLRRLRRRHQERRQDAPRRQDGDPRTSTTPTSSSSSAARRSRSGRPGR